MYYLCETINETENMSEFDNICETVNETENNMKETDLCDIETKNIIDCNVKETDNIISEGVIEINIVDKCISETSKIASSVNKSNLSPATINESWSKHLFWPKPDTKQKPSRSQVKLPLAVTVIEWREYHVNKEQEKLRKEEELTQKERK